MKKIFFVFLSVCLMASCFGPAFAASPNLSKNSSYIETDHVDGSDNMVDLDGEKAIFYDVSSAVALNSDEESEYPSFACQVEETCVEICDDDHDYAEYELVVSAIDDDTYEVAMPDGRVLGVLHADNDENPAVPYSTQYTINWSVHSNTSARATTFSEVGDGSTVYFSISADPTGDSKLGFYAYDESAYYWFTDTWKRSVSGNFTFSYAFGLIAPALCNMSTQTITYSGWYTI